MTAYCSLSDVKAYLAISETTDDALIEAAIEAAHAAVDNYCGTSFGIEDDTTEYFNYRESSDPPRKGLSLGRKRLAAMTTAQVGGNDVTDYVITKGAPIHTIILPRSSGYSWASINDVDIDEGIAITGKWGYSTSVPAPVKQATIIWSAFIYRLKDVQFDGTLATATNGQTTPTPQLPDHATALLATYTLGF
jgi:hypothetical protein